MREVAEPLRDVDPRLQTGPQALQGQRGERSGMRISISVAVLAAAALWALSVALLTYDTLDSVESDVAGRWAIVSAIAAATWTGVLVTNHCRRVILEVMSWEHWRMEADGGPETRRGGIRAVR